MWLPQTNLFITNSHVAFPDSLLQNPYPHRNTVCDIRAPSKQDSDLRRASLAQARAEAQNRFHNTHYRMSENPAMAKYVVQTVVRTQNELRTHDEGEQGNIWNLGTCITGWKGVVKDPDNPSKTFWVDLAVASGDPCKWDPNRSLIQRNLHAN